MADEQKWARGTVNSLRDIGLVEPDTKPMKADLTAEVSRILRERNITNAKATKLTGVQQADISRIRNAQLDRFTIDRAWRRF